jgi:pectin methylesterase-like acyl-CoA thioesterase/methionine-rich copper-binding protein CopC
MKKLYYLFLGIFFLALTSNAQEKLLYSTDFQNWAAISTLTTETSVSKTTDFSGETINFKFLQVAVNPTAIDATRFVYASATPSAGGAVVTAGWAQAQKVAGSYIELSPLNSITKVVFTHGATGSSRGYKLWKKNATDASWVAVSTAFASPAAGQTVTVNINESNVAIKFTNLNETNNAYLFDLKIYGNYTPTNTQYALNTSLSIADAGSITRTPNATEYDAGTAVSLQATPNFGYKFVKWVNADNNADLSTNNPYSITVNGITNVKAVFQAVNTYNFTVNKAGSLWGEIQLSPTPINGKYEDGTEVTMKVVPNAVTNFSYWEDNSTYSQRTVMVNADKTFTATFDEIPFIVGWDFKAQTPKESRAGDFYSESTNTGLISSYEPSGTPVGWLSSAGTFSPSYPALRFWTLGANFASTRRYLKAQFSTIGYKNIQIKSLVSGNYQTYSKQKLQYSLDDVTYTDLANVDITTAYNASWKDLNGTLPVGAEGQTKVYLKWIADETSPILGNSADNDGTAFTNVFVFADKLIVNDVTAPTLISSVPANASLTASINGAVVLTFDEKVKAGTGNITLGTTAVTGSYGSKTATFYYEKLNYDTPYTFTVPAGALTDLTGNAYAGTSFTFRTGVRLEPTKKLFDAVVAKDGSGDYISVIDAIAAAPINRAAPWVIYIKNGKYTGHHDIPSTKPFIHLIGQSRNGVIISDNRLCGDAGTGNTVYHVSLGATMVVNSTNCYFENMILENSFGFENQAGPQALALYAVTNKFAMNNCYLRSYQDTYLSAYSSIADRQYIKNSKIEGAVDFIYGGGDVFFDRDTIQCDRKDGGYIVAPSHGNGTAWGYVFSNCTVTEKIAGSTTYFGRPWQNAPKTVFINTKLNTSIYASGWYFKMGAIPAVFADYNSTNASGNAVDLSQRISTYQYDIKDASGNVTSTVTGTAKKSLTDAEAASYTYENVILRSGDSWDPRMIAEAPNKPTNLQKSGSNITWDAVPYTRLYIVFRNATAIGFTLNNAFTDNTTGTNTYSVQAVSEFGALSLLSNNIQTLPITGLEVSAKKVNHTIAINWSTKTEINTSHFIIERSLDGNIFDALGQVAAAGNSNTLNKYSFTDKAPVQGNDYYRIKSVDNDGKFTYSSIVVVKILGDLGISVYPTLTNSTIQVNHAKVLNQSSIKIFNTSGQLVKSVLVDQNATQTEINVANLSSGVYVITFENNTTSINTKFIKE